MTQRNIILKVLDNSHGWVKSWELEKAQTEYGWIGTSGGRRCRELAEEGLIESKREGKYVFYRAKQPLKVSMYEPKYKVSPQQSLL